jgi:hypothetical protein
MKADVSGRYKWFVSNKRGARSIITAMFADRVNKSKSLRSTQLVPETEFS